MAKKSLKERRLRKGNKRRDQKQLDEALALYQSGDLAGAERLYGEIVTRNPVHAVALHHLSLIKHGQGALEEAISLLERSLGEHTNDVHGWTNLGNFYYEQGRAKCAVDAYRRALQLAPSHGNALHNLGAALLDLGHPAEAVKPYRQLIELDEQDVDAWHALGSALEANHDVLEAENAYRAALERRPNFALAWYELGNLLRRKRCLEEARSALLNATTLEPGFAAAHNNLGLVYRALGFLDKAVACFEQAIQLRPEHLETHKNLSGALLASNDLDGASKAMAKAVENSPDDALSRVYLGDIYFLHRDYPRAEQAFRSAIEVDPKSPDAHSALGKVLEKLSRAVEAEQACRRAIKLDPTHADGHGNLGVALKSQSRLTDAIEAFQKALSLAPNYAETHNNLGLAYVDNGDFAKAQDCFERALTLAPDMPEVMLNIATTRKFSPSDNALVDSLEAQVADRNLNLESRIVVNFALGKVFDDRGEFEAAVEHYHRGNALKAETVAFNRAQHVISMKSLRDTFDGELFSRLRSLGSPSQLPVFIVGVPRSGTSLVEQILASHRDFYGADELAQIWEISKQLSVELGSSNTYPQNVAELTATVCQRLSNDYLDVLRNFSNEAQRISDKMPFNFMHLGLIAILFPKAKIIHCRRDPRDVCLSNYFQLYPHGHHHTYRLDDLVLFYREYQRLMDYWHQYLPITIHEVVYEDLVANMEDVTRSLLDYLELPWDRSCLTFHETRRPVQTASHWQVKQPLYRSAIARWKNYEFALGDFFAALPDNSTL